jgi:hypothetical protein
LRREIERELRQPSRDRLCERARRLARVVLRGTQPGRRVDRLADPHQHARAEDPLGVEGQAHGQDARGGRAPLAHGPEHDARGAGLEPCERRGVVADAFWEERDGAAAGELVEAAAEGLVVLRRVHALVLAAVHRHRAGEIEQLPDAWQLPERALGQEARAHAERCEQQQRIDQAVVVVRDHQERHALRDPIAPLHLDLAEEEVREQACETFHEAVELRSRGHARESSRRGGAERPEPPRRGREERRTGDDTRELHQPVVLPVAGDTQHAPQHLLGDGAQPRTRLSSSERASQLRSTRDCLRQRSSVADAIVRVEDQEQRALRRLG